jgi:hypothetical protein
VLSLCRCVVAGVLEAVLWLLGVLAGIARRHLPLGCSSFPLRDYEPVVITDLRGTIDLDLILILI